MGSEMTMVSENLKRRRRPRKVAAVVMALALPLSAVGADKKAPAPPPPPPPKVVTPAPVVERPNITQFEAEPTTIENGHASTPRWAVSGQATGISIAPGIGSVDASGNRQVYLCSTATYTLN